LAQGLRECPRVCRPRPKPPGMMSTGGKIYPLKKVAVKGGDNGMGRLGKKRAYGANARGN